MALTEPAVGFGYIKKGPELVVEGAPGEREVIEEMLRREMDAAFELKVPLEVSVGAGANWDEAAH